MENKYFTTIVVEDEPIESMAFKKAQNKFEEWYDENFPTGETFSETLYSYEVVLLKKSYIHYDFGDRDFWKYEFAILKY